MTSPTAAALRKRADELDAEIAEHQEAVNAAFLSGAVLRPSRPVWLLGLLAAEFRAVADLAAEGESRA